MAGKILSIVFPISAFVALGFEHSVANMFLVPLGMYAGGLPAVAAAPAGGLGAFLTGLAVVTAGNVVGGAGFVALVYYLVYRRCGARGL